jgi:hypothetical protein
MKKLILTSICGTALALCPEASAATIITETATLSSTAVIPDGDLSGLLQSLVHTSNIAVLTHVSLTLNTTGGWNGDLFAYLWHNGKLVTVVNRPGKTAAMPDGSSSSGMSVTLDDAAATDLHAAVAAAGMAVSGNFQPDGRDADPLVVLDTSPRPDKLADFNGDAGGGQWRLFIADVASGEVATVTSWTVTLTGEQIPEPSASVLLLSGLALLGRRRRRA